MQFLVILLLSLVCHFFGPWWSFIMIAFLAAFLFRSRPRRAFLSAFGAIAFLWTCLALLQTLPNDNRLVARMATQLGLPNWEILLLITVLIGGITAGVAAASGAGLRAAFFSKNRKTNPSTEITKV